MTQSILQSTTLAAALCLLAPWAAAQTAVHITGQFELPGLVDASGAAIPPGNFAIDFTLPADLAGLVPESADSFYLNGVAMDTVVNGQPLSTTSTRAGWFAYGSDHYYGVDLRFYNLLQLGDYAQLIVVTPAPLFSGSADQPSLLAYQSPAFEYGSLGFYSPTSDALPGTVTNLSYTATPAATVPEPATAGLWLLGLAAVPLWARHRAAAATRPANAAR